MADGALHPDDDSIAQGQRAIRAAVERRLGDIVKDKATARMAFERREQAARFILDGLDGGDWLDVSAQIARRLTEEERVQLLYCAIKSVPDELAAIALKYLFVVDVPAVDADDHKASAKYWADEASPAEIRAFVSAGIKRMPPETRERMRRWLNKEADG